MPLLRHSLRSLAKSPAFVVTVVLTLALGIGLNAAVFAVVDTVLLEPLGYHHASRIVGIETRFDQENRSIGRLGGDDYVDLARDVHGLVATAQYQSDEAGIKIDGTALYVPVADVTAQFPAVVRVEPVAGTLFSATQPSEDAPAATPASRSGTGDDREVLLGEGFARAHFGSAAAAIGRPITYDGRIYTVTGVLPAGFSFPGRTEAWFERAVQPGNRTSYNDRVIGRRAESVTPAQLAAELATFSAGLARQYSEDRVKSLHAVPLQQQLTGRLAPTLHLLMASVAVVLLVVVANIAHLLLVRALRNGRAVSVRMALGASRWQLLAAALVETAVLAVLGSVAALVVAWPALRLLVRMAPASTPRLAEIQLNLHAMLFAGFVSFAVMLVAAMLPVWRSWHVDPAQALRQDSSRGTEGRGTLRLRNGFVVAEVALTLMLAVAATLLARELVRQSRQDLGFEPARLVTLDTHAVTDTPMLYERPDSTPEEKLAAQRAGESRLARLDATLRTVAAVPGVEAVGAIAAAPLLSSGSNVGYAIRGRTVFSISDRMADAEVRVISPSVIGALGMHVLRGRNLDSTDRAGAPFTLLINQALADQQFRGKDPVGQQIMCGYDSENTWWTIVGVVSDIRASSPALPPDPTFYIPVAQHVGPADEMQLVVRTAPGMPASLAGTLTRTLNRALPGVAVAATTMQANLAETQRADTLRDVLFVSFAAVAILLAAIGIFGVTAYTVAERRFEFGLRIALGATPAQVLGDVLRRAAVLAALGIGIGAVLALVLTRVIGSTVGPLPPFDTVAYLFSAAAVLAVAVLAALGPARQAAHADPMRVLRGE